MQQFEDIKKYTDAVCNQIRWKKIRPMIATEIENHIWDQRDAYIKEGFSQKEATEKSIIEMGDPVTIGEEFDESHKPKAQWGMIGMAIILTLIGVGTNYIVSGIGGQYESFEWLQYIVAFGILLGCYYLDFTILGKYSLHIYIGIVFISFVFLIFANQIAGSYSISILGNSIALEYLSLIYPLAFSLLVFNLRGTGYKGILLSFIGVTPLVFILFMIPSIIGIITLLIVGIMVMCFALHKDWFKVNKKKALIIVGIPGGLTLISLIGILISKVNIKIFINPATNKSGLGFLYYNIRDIIDGAYLIGKTQSIETLNMVNNLPFINSDYVLLYLVTQVGMWIVILVSLIVIVFTVIATYKIKKQKSLLGVITTVSIIIPFVINSILFITNNLGYGIVESLPIAFVGRGTVSLLINSGLIGFMLSVFRTGYIYSDSSSVFKKDTYFFNRS